MIGIDSLRTLTIHKPTSRTIFFRSICRIFISLSGEAGRRAEIQEPPAHRRGTGVTATGKKQKRNASTNWNNRKNRQAKQSCHRCNAPTGHFDDFSSQSSANGVFFLFVDGHVRFISENINEVIYRRLASRAGKEVVPDEF